MPSRSRGMIALAAAALTAGVAGCTSAGTTAAKTTSPPPPKVLSATEAVKLAVGNAQKVNSFTALISVQADGSSAGNSAFSGTFKEQRKPLRIAEDFSTFQAAGQSLGSMSMIITPTEMYLKLGMITQMLHTSKPWVEFPISALKSSDSLSQLLGQAQTNDPLSDAKLLDAVTNLRTVGPDTVDGTPVTEYTGSATINRAMAELPASVRTQFGQQAEQLGIGEINFKVWIDGQRNIRQEISTMTGSTVTVTTTMTTTSINQPVTITMPSASQTTSVPASALSGSGV